MWKDGLPKLQFYNDLIYYVIVREIGFKAIIKYINTLTNFNCDNKIIKKQTNINFPTIIDENVILMLDNKFMLGYLFIDIINKELGGKFWILDNINNQII